MREAGADQSLLSFFGPPVPKRKQAVPRLSPIGNENYSYQYCTVLSVTTGDVASRRGKDVLGKERPRTRSTALPSGCNVFLLGRLLSQLMVSCQRTLG